MSKSTPDKIRSFFEEFCRRLRDASPDRRAEPSGFSRWDRCSLESLLGDMGKKINSFLDSVDESHPELRRCYNGLFGCGSDFSKVVMELLHCHDHAKSNGYATAQEILSAQSRKYIEERFPDTLKIDTPERNRCNVRMIPDKEKREAIRRQKRMQIIMMESVCKKGCSHFESHPDNFMKYMRFDQSLKSELERLEERALRYENIGCHALSSEIRSSLQPYHEQVKNTYYGFNRITISSASVILARNLGFFAAKHSLSDECKIQVGKEYLGDHSLLSESVEMLDYEPVIYPLSDFESQMTANMRSVVDTLDSFHDAGGKAIFDFYGLVVPSVKIPYHEGFFGFKGSCGTQRLHQDYLGCKSDFDKIMVESFAFRPILVAEKDHKCYFITYWL